MITAKRRNRSTNKLCKCTSYIMGIAFSLLLISFVAISYNYMDESFSIPRTDETKATVIDYMTKMCFKEKPNSISACNSTVVVFGDFDGCSAPQLNSIFSLVSTKIDVSTDSLSTIMSAQVIFRKCSSISTAAQLFSGNNPWALFVIRSSCMSPVLRNDPDYVYLYADSIMSLIDDVHRFNPLIPVLLDIDSPQYERKDFIDIFTHISFHHILQKENVLWPKFPLYCVSKGILGCKFTKSGQVKTCDMISIPPTVADAFIFHKPGSLHTRCFHLLNSRKYSSNCFPRPQKLYPLLITGAGGAGSHAIAFLLRSSGIDVRHEYIGEQGSIGWQYAFNDARYEQFGEYPHTARLRATDRDIISPRFEKVLFLSRSPLDQISALTTHKTKSFDFIKTNMLKSVEFMSLDIANTVIESISVLQKEEVFSEKVVSNSTARILAAAGVWIYFAIHIRSYSDADINFIENPTESFRKICSFVSTSEKLRCMSAINKFNLSVFTPPSSHISDISDHQSITPYQVNFCKQTYELSPSYTTERILESSQKLNSFIKRRNGKQIYKYNDEISISVCEHVILTNMRSHFSVSLKDINEKCSPMVKIITELYCEFSSENCTNFDYFR